MKRIIALLLTLALVFAFTACSDKKDSGSSDEDDTTAAPVKEDNTLPGMSFDVPEGFTAVERSLDKSGDGDLTEKTIRYYFGDDVSLAFMHTELSDQQLSDLLDLDDLETVDCDGETFYIYEEGDAILALAEVNEFFYGVDYERAQGDTNRDRFDDALKSIKFENTDTVSENNDDLGDITDEEFVKIQNYLIFRRAIFK